MLNHCVILSLINSLMNFSNLRRDAVNAETCFNINVNNSIANGKCENIAVSYRRAEVCNLSGHFACAELDNLAATVQLSDTGISPGSGVNNSRAEISQRTLGLPCIAVGIPTVADIAAVTDDPAVPKGMIMTPGRIDTVVSRGAALIALSVNLALHRSLTVDEINSLVG